MKDWIISACGVIGSTVSYLVGGFDAALLTLCIFMVIDFITGIIVAGIFKASAKTESGALSSKVGFKGLAKKCMILLFVLIGAQLDIVLQAHFVRDGVCIAFIANELISIVENAGLMGVSIPAPIQKALDMLIKSKSKTENESTDKDEPRQESENKHDDEYYNVFEDHDEYEDEEDEEDDEEDEDK